MRKTRYEYVLFDLDGTIIDSAPQISQCVNLAMTELGEEALGEKALRAFLGPPLMDSFQNICHFSYEKAEEATAIYRKHYNAGIVLESGLYNGAVEMLRAVRKAGMKTSLATSKPEGMAVRILEHQKAAGELDVITGADLNDRIRHSKADVVEEALRRLGVDRKDYDKVVMVGDRKYDVLGAKSFGLDCIGVAYGYADPGELEAAGADVILETMEDLKNYLIEEREVSHE